MRHILRNNDNKSVVNSAKHDPAEIGKGRNPLVSTKRGEIPAGKNRNPLVALCAKRVQGLKHIVRLAPSIKCKVLRCTAGKTTSIRIHSRAWTKTKGDKSREGETGQMPTR
jgi:hypothetical protein